MYKKIKLYVICNLYLHFFVICLMEVREENNLILRIIEGDKESYELLVRKYQDMVFTICMRILKHNQEAEEVAQDAFIKAYYNLGSFRSASKFSTWLYTITYRLAISRLRKINREHTYVLDDENETASGNHIPVWPDHLEHADRIKYIRKCLDCMNEFESIALSLYYLDNCSIKEVAGIMNRTESSVKVLLFRGRKSMMSILKSLLKGEINSVL